MITREKNFPRSPSADLANNSAFDSQLRFNSDLANSKTIPSPQYLLPKGLNFGNPFEDSNGNSDLKNV